jgi:uncharacterized protein
MLNLENPATGGFCWLDLATSDAAAAREFYSRAFGWTFHDRHVCGGVFTVAHLADRDFASLYQLRQTQLAQGVPSHWTPYVRVASVDEACSRLPPLGGEVIVRPFDVAGTARISLVQDAVGALLGLWQPLAEEGHG